MAKKKMARELNAKNKTKPAKRKPKNTFMRVMRVRLTEDELSGSKEVISNAQAHLKSLMSEFAVIQRKFSVAVKKEKQLIATASREMQKVFVECEVECFDDVDKKEGVVLTKIVATGDIIAKRNLETDVFVELLA